MAVLPPLLRPSAPPVEGPQPPPTFDNTMASSVPPLEPIKEPATVWGQLTGPVEGTRQRVCRYVGAFLALMAIPCAGATLYVRNYLVASPDTIINAFYRLRQITVGSAVVGITLYCFNRLKINPKTLQELRDQLQKEIKLTPLAALRMMYPNPLVFSTKELNEWLRYFLHAQPFDKMIESQKDIFKLKRAFEGGTFDLFKEKYLEHVDCPLTRPGLKDLIQQEGYINLLSEDEKKSLRLRTAVTEASILNWNSIDYQSLFIERNGVEALRLIKEESANYPDLLLHLLQILSTGFITYINQKAIGILQVKKDHAEELEIFGTNIRSIFYESILNREAAGSYEDFIARNGVEALSSITDTHAKEGLFERFKQHVIKQNLGLIETKKKFKDAIERFAGNSAEIIYKAVLEKEGGQLSTKGYKQFRQRNGYDTIEWNTFGNFNMIEQFKAHFLQLPYADLIDPEFAPDRDQLNISYDDIRTALSNRWKAMTLQAILAADPQGFLASMKNLHCPISGKTVVFFSPRDWTAKAVAETQVMSVATIVKTFPALFAARVLTAQDGNLTTRLAAEITPIASFADLVGTYGAFIFDYELVDPASTKVCTLIADFLYNNAAACLEGSLKGTSADLLSKYMIADLRAIVESKKNQRNAEVESNQRRLKELTNLHERGIHELDTSAEADITVETVKANIPDKKKAHRQANAQLQTASAAHVVLQNEITKLQTESSDIERKIHNMEREFSSLDLKRMELAARNIPWHLSNKENELNQATFAVQSAENTRAWHLSKNATLAEYQRSLESAKEQKAKLEEEIARNTVIQNEQQELKKIIEHKDFAKIKKALQDRVAHPAAFVRGLAEAEAAQQAPKNLEIMQEQERKLERLTTQLKNMPKNLDSELSLITTTIEQIQVNITTITAKYPAVDRSAVEMLTAQVGALRKDKAELEEMVQKIQDVVSEIQRLNENKTLVNQNLSIKLVALAPLIAELTRATRNEASTKSALQEAEIHLAAKTTELRQACERKKKALRDSITTEIATEIVRHSTALFENVIAFQEDIVRVRQRI